MVIFYFMYGDLVGTQSLVRFHEPPCVTCSPNVAPPPANASTDATGILLATLFTDAHGNVTLAQGPNGRCVAYAYDPQYRQLLHGDDNVHRLADNSAAGAMHRRHAR